MSDEKERKLPSLLKREKLGYVRREREREWLPSLLNRDKPG